MISTEITIKLIGRGTVIVKRIRKSSTRIENLLRELGINPLSVVVFKNNVMVTEDDIAEPGDVIEVYAVSPGGLSW